MSKNNQISNSENPLLKVAGSFINKLTIVGSLLIVIGFFTIQSYLRSLSPSSGIFSYNISLTNYLSAGISLFLGVFLYILQITFPVFLNTLVIIIGLYVVFSLFNLGYRYILSKNKDVNKNVNKFTPIIRKIWNIAKIIYNSYIVLSVISSLIMIILLSIAYGQFLYPRIPRYLGGGEPANVIIVFDEAQPTQESVWGFPINPTNPRHSEQLQLIIELADGVMVRHESTNTVVILKNDVIQGIIYVQTPAPSTP